MSSLSLNEVLARVVVAFPRSEFNRDEAVATYTERFKHLTVLGAPEEVLALYRNPNVVRCRVATAGLLAYLQFDVWDGRSLRAYAHPEDSSECTQIAYKLAEILGYDCSQEEYD